MTIMTTPALRHSGDYEQLILFVKPFCAFFIKICKTIGFFLISYKYTIQILQTISSVINSLYSGFVMYSAPVKAFFISFGFYGKLFGYAKNACLVQAICWNRFTQNRNALSLKINHICPHKRKCGKEFV